MTRIKNGIRSHPVLAYFILTLTISWGLLFILLGPGGFTGTAQAADSQLPFLFLAMFAGPSLASILLTGLGDGGAGLRHLISRLLKWRLGGGWYVLVLLATPLIMVSTLLALSIISPGFLPAIFLSGNHSSLILTAVAAGLMTGFFEELGWTGYATPRLKTRHGILTTGILVGILWGTWHYPLFAGGDPSGGVCPLLYIPVLLFSHLPAFRVLMVWVYEKTGSLFATILMHGSLTAGTLIFQPQRGTGVYMVTYNLILAAILWILVITVTTKKQQ